MKALFLLKASTARTSPDFSIKSLAGSSGRLDVVCRCLIAALAKPGGIRRFVEFQAVLEGPPNPPKLLVVKGEELRELPLSEVEVAEQIFKVLQGLKVEGFQLLEKISFRKAVDKVVDRGFQLIYLHEKGGKLKDMLRGEKIAFVLGDHLGLDRDSEAYLDSKGAVRVSLGPHSYMASHCIAAVLRELGVVLAKRSPEMVEALKDC